MTTRPQITATSGLLPHQIAILGPQQADAEKSFRLANASYRTIRALGEIADLRWLRVRAAKATVRLAGQWS